MLAAPFGRGWRHMELHMAKTLSPAVNAEPGPAVDAAWVTEDDVSFLEGPDLLNYDRAWHHRFNRSLACSSHALSCLTFSHDGRWLISGTGSGDMKVWDSSSWAVVAILKGARREEPNSIVFSPAQRWIATVQPSLIQVFKCEPPWNLEQELAGMVCPGNEEASDWICAAFAPGAEVDHEQGKTGSSNHMVVLASTHVCVLDYGSGWNEDTPKRTHSILRCARPTGVTYTPCCRYIVCAFGNGQMQIWNAASLTLERKLSAHIGPVTGLTSSPSLAEYQCRIVTCGVDYSIRVWHSVGWVMEQLVPDRVVLAPERTRDEFGVISCSFSACGTWLISVAREFNIWRVCLDHQSQLSLRLHQRIEGMCCVDGFRTAAYGSHRHVVVAGSRDGVLGVWARYSGLPPPPAISGAPQPTALADSNSTSSPLASPLPRPMMKVSCEAEASKTSRYVPSRGPEGWCEKWQLRSTLTALPTVYNRRAGHRSSTSSLASTDTGSGSLNSKSRMHGSSSMPELTRWRSRSFAFDTVISSQMALCHHVIAQAQGKSPNSQRYDAVRPGLQ